MKRNKSIKWVKPATIVLAVVGLVCAVLVGVQTERRAANSHLLQVGKTRISREIYSYFVSEAISDGTVELNKNGTPKDMKLLREEVKRRCTEFVAVQSELSSHQRSISQQLKLQAAERSAFVWRTFGSYYTSIGVDKPTINTIWLGLSSREQLFRTLYDDDTSPRKVPDESMQAYFYGNYVAIEALKIYQTVALDDGTERPMTIAERGTLRAQLDSLVQASNQEGAVFALVASEESHAVPLNYATPAEMLLQKTDGDMPPAVFDQLREWGPDTVSLLLVDDSYYLVGRGINMREAAGVYYAVHRNECLWALKGAEYEGLLQELFKGYKANENAKEVDRLLKNWPWEPVPLTTTEAPTTTAVTEAEPETTTEAVTTTEATTTTGEEEATTR